MDPRYAQTAGLDEVCCFQDMAGISASTAKCSAHADRECIVLGSKDGVLIHWAGFSCKTLSKLSQDQAPGALPANKGSTGSTLAWLIDHLREHQPPIYIGENVEELMTTAGNMHYLQAAMHDIKYSVMMRILVSSKFTSPQNRKRTWIVALHLRLCKLTPQEARTLLEQVFATVEKLMEESPTPLREFVLDDESEYLKCLRKSKAARMQADDCDNKWQKQYPAMLAKQGIRTTKAYPPQDIRQSVDYDLLCERQRLVLGYELKMDPDATSVDCYQTMGRAFIGHDGILSTLVPGSNVWVRMEGMNRLLCGREHMYVQGMPRSFPVEQLMKDFDISDHMLKDLAGNAFSAQVAMAVLIAVILNLPPLLISEMERVTHASHSADEDDVLSSIAA